MCVCASASRKAKQMSNYIMTKTTIIPASRSSGVCADRYARFQTVLEKFLLKRLRSIAEILRDSPVYSVTPRRIARPTHRSTDNSSLAPRKRHYYAPVFSILEQSYDGDRVPSPYRGAFSSYGVIKTAGTFAVALLLFDLSVSDQS